MSVGTAKASELPVLAPDVTKASQHSGTAAIVFVALCDSAAPLGYMFLGTAHPVHAAAIALKFVALLVVGRRGTLSRPVLLWFCLVLFLFVEGIALDATVLGSFYFESTRYLAIVVHIALTLLLIPIERFRTYVSGLVVIPFSTFVAHILLAHLGQIGTVSGRLLYLGNTHPNLGGEIGAAAVLAAALSLRLRYFIPVVAVIGYSCFTMQTRAALLAVMLTTFSRLWLDLGKGHRIVALIVGAISVPVFLVFDMVSGNGVLDSFVNYISNVIFLADNPYRGVGTGFVGREALWAQAWNLFESHPFFGVGVSFFSQTEYGSPHNAFLYGLAMHGIWSVPFWALIIFLAGILMTRCPREGLLIACMFPLIMLNDRFINMNPYPSYFYLFLFLVYQYSIHLRRNHSPHGTPPPAEEANLA